MLRLTVFLAGALWLLSHLSRLSRTARTGERRVHAAVLAACSLAVAPAVWMAERGAQFPVPNLTRELEALDVRVGAQPTAAGLAASDEVQIYYALARALDDEAASGLATVPVASRRPQR